MTADLVVWLRQQFDHDESLAYAAMAELDHRGDWVCWVGANDGPLQVVVDDESPGDRVVATVDEPAGGDVARHIAVQDPATVLRQVAAHRAILDVIMAWKHHYNEEDRWYSCGLAVDPDETDAGPGLGSDHDGRRGHCDCGLEARRMALLAPLAFIYSDRPGYDPAWKVDG